MNILPISMIRQKKVDEVLALLPIKITSDGEIVAVMAKPDDIIVVQDLHPRVRNMLKALEAKARMGMRKDVRPDYLVVETKG